MLLGEGAGCNRAVVVVGLFTPRRLTHRDGRSAKRRSHSRASRVSLFCMRTPAAAARGCIALPRAPPTRRPHSRRHARQPRTPLKPSPAPPESSGARPRLGAFSRFLHCACIQTRHTLSHPPLRASQGANGHVCSGSPSGAPSGRSSGAPPRGSSGTKNGDSGPGGATGCSPWPEHFLHRVRWPHGVLAGAAGRRAGPAAAGHYSRKCAAAGWLERCAYGSGALHGLHAALG